MSNNGVSITTNKWYSNDEQTISITTHKWYSNGEQTIYKDHTYYNSKETNSAWTSPVLLSGTHVKDLRGMAMVGQQVLVHGLEVICLIDGVFQLFVKGFNPAASPVV